MLYIHIDHVKVIILSVLEKACKDVFIVKHMGFMLHALGCFCLVCMYIYIYVCVYIPKRGAIYLNVIFSLFTSMCISL